VRSAEAVADLAQDTVTGIVPEPLVHRSEVIGVDEEKAERPLRLSGLVEGQPQPRLELGATREPGDGIVQDRRYLRGVPHENAAEAQKRCPVIPSLACLDRVAPGKKAERLGAVVALCSSPGAARSSKTSPTQGPRGSAHLLRSTAHWASREGRARRGKPTRGFFARDPLRSPRFVSEFLVRERVALRALDIGVLGERQLAFGEEDGAPLTGRRCVQRHRFGAAHTPHERNVSPE
jgi:hypothetical protein